MKLVADLTGSGLSLHKREFVLPIRRILEGKGHRTEVVGYEDLRRRMEGVGGERDGISTVVLSGTALKDNEYQNGIDAFRCLRNFRGTILGICAGMHVLGALWGGEIVPDRRIGVFPYEIVRADPVITDEGPGRGYHLHNYGVALPSGDFLTLAATDGAPVAVKHRERNVYGVAFHPEVMNRGIIERAAGILMRPELTPNNNSSHNGKQH